MEKSENSPFFAIVCVFGFSKKT